jgi:hypothetical protein
MQRLAVEAGTELWFQGKSRVAASTAVGAIRRVFRYREACALGESLWVSHWEALSFPAPGPK